MRDNSPFGPVHASLPDSTKTRRLANALDVSREQVVGHLVSMWARALVQASDGDLSGWRDEDIAELAGWKNGAKAFVDALHLCGWLTKKRHLHEWETYFGKFLEQRRSDALRMANSRKRNRKQPASCSRTVPEQFANATQAESKIVREQFGVRGEERRGEEKRREQNTEASSSAGAGTVNAVRGERTEPEQPDEAADQTEESVRAGCADGATPMSRALFGAGRVSWGALNRIKGQPGAAYGRKPRAMYEDAVQGGQVPSRVLGAILALHSDTRGARWWRGEAEAYETAPPSALSIWQRVLEAPEDMLARFLEDRQRAEPVERPGRRGKQDTHGTRITIPPGYSWDRHDEMALEMGKRWTGGGWA